ncbi:MAG: leucine dehydrogenase [Solirubrobacteraceae bacterium]|jgi:leucine dehydrogenase|nr:leucine dehydrogenase [Solirubrobacteraceae bacterium]
MWSYGDTGAAIDDALRLARAMTYKAACAGLPLGGGKGVIALPDGAPRGHARRDVLLDFGETVDALAGSYVTAEDVGTSSRDMTVIAQATSHVSGLAQARGGSGDPSPYTALGVQEAVLASCERAFGSRSLKGRSVAVVGLGSVGLRLARLLARRGATLVVTDIDEGRRADAERLGARWAPPDRALTAEVDVLAPCALGGMLNEETVPRLQAPVIAGAANNQLADDAVADLLAGRGILWAPDFVCNAGGIINISVELEPEGYDPRRARRRVQGIGDTLQAIYDAAGGDTTPLQAAMDLARRRLAEPPG